MANVVQQLYAPHGAYAAPLGGTARAAPTGGAHGHRAHTHAHGHQAAGHRATGALHQHGAAAHHGHAHHGHGHHATRGHGTRTHASSSHRRSGERRSSSTDHERHIVEDRRVGKDGRVTVVRRYLQTRLLGKGGFAKCYKFTGLDRHNHKKVFAGKVVVKSSLKKKSAREKLKAEIIIHKSLRHKHVVRFDTYFEDDENVYIVLDLCENQSLMELLRRRKRLTEEETKYYIMQILEAIKYLHVNLVIHRDLKLSNVFLGKDMQVKIGDFGLAAKLNSPTQKRTTICGTPNYLAPEILDGKKTGHSFEVDVWSVGVIMYTMLVGRPPFETNDVKATYKRIRANSYAFPSSVHVSEHAKSLIRWVLHHSPASRPSINDMVNHPFFTNPKSFIPVSLPESSLRTVPTFRPEQLMRGSRVVAAFLAQRPEQHKIGSITSSSGKDGRRKPAPPYALKSNTGSGAKGTEATVASAGSRGSGKSRGSGSRGRHGEGGSSRKPFAPVSQNTETVKSGKSSKTRRALEGGASAATKPWAACTGSADGTAAAEVPVKAAAPTSASVTPPAAPVPVANKRREGWAASAEASGPPVGAKLGAWHATPATDAAKASPQLAAAAAAAVEAAGMPPAAPTVAAPKPPYYASHALLGSTGGAGSTSTGGVGAVGARGPTGSPAGTGEAAPDKWASSRAPATGAASAGVAAPAPVRAAARRDGDAMAQTVPAPPSAAGAAPVHSSTGASSGADAGSSAPAPSTRATTAPGGSRAAVGGMTTSPRFTAHEPASRAPRSHAAKHSHTAAAATATASVAGAAEGEGTSDRHHASGAKHYRHHRPSAPISADTLKDIHEHLSRSLAVRDDATGTAPLPVDEPAAGDSPSSWVCTWVDYTSKYGLGYLLSDGAVGVYFNDSTKIILASDNEHFEYIERSSSSSGRRREIVRKAHKLSSFPESLTKKVTLLKHFRGYLMEQYRKNPMKPAEEVAAMAAGSVASDMTFVKKWVRTRHAVLFRLSNQQVQVNFFDHTSLLLSRRARLVTFVDKQHNRSTQTLAEIMSGGRGDITKRLQYTKDILQQLISGARK